MTNFSTGTHFSPLYSPLTATFTISTTVPSETVGKQPSKPPLTFDPWDMSITDGGNADRFVHRHGDNVRYCNDLRSWLIWKGDRWQIDSSDQIIQLGDDTVRAIFKEVPDTETQDRFFRLNKWAIQSCSTSRISNMLKLAQSKVPLPFDKLDQNPWLLNCKNGVLDLRTGLMRQPSREDWITKQVSVSYEPDAKCDRFLAFMEQITDSDRELQTYIQKALGYSLTGETAEQSWFVAHGEGANGKSTLLNLVRKLLGDYAKNAAVHTFTQKKNEGGPREDLVRLRDTRFLTCTEAEGNQKFADALIKQITGGDTVTARDLFKGSMEFVPQFKVWLATNHKPKIDGADNANWRRIKLIPFDVTVPENDRDPELPLKLWNEAPGVLAWMVRGALDWKANGLKAPDTVQKATKNYRFEMDETRRFIDEYLRFDPNSTVTKKTMSAIYQTWAQLNEGDEIGIKQLTIKLRAAGLKDGKSGNDRLWKGVAVRFDQIPQH